MKPQLRDAARAYLAQKCRKDLRLNREPTVQELTDWSLLQWSRLRGGDRSDSMSSVDPKRRGAR